MRTYFSIVFLLFVSQNIIHAQNYSVGGGIGFGSFMGDFPSQTTFAGKVFIETPSPLTIFNNLQVSLSLAQKSQKFLPDYYDYEHYSYFINIGLSGIFKQFLNESIIVKENVGIIYLNDRSFDDIDYWNLGIALGFSAETELNADATIFIGVDYGLTFMNTNVHYLNLLAGLQYKL